MVDDALVKELKGLLEAGADAADPAAILKMMEFFKQVSKSSEDLAEELEDMDITVQMILTDIDKKFWIKATAYGKFIKIWDPEYGDGQEIKITPQGAVHMLQSDIEYIDVYVLNQWEYQETIYDDEFTFDADSGTLTLDGDVIGRFKKIIEGEYSSHHTSPIILECFVKQYRSINDSRGLSSEQMQSIATMQFIQASLLEYMMQFQLAVESQSKMNEIAYTVAITVITTALTLGIGGALGIGGGSALGLIKEPLEEVFVDPIIEAIATKIVKDLGGDEYAQMIASTLAESGREGLSLRNARSNAQFNQEVKLKMDTKTGMTKAEAIRLVKAEMKANQQDSSKASKVAKAALMTLSIFGLVLGMGGMFGTGGLGITALSMFFMSHGGGFIDFLERLREQEQINQNEVEVDNFIATTEADESRTYRAKLAYTSQFIENLKRESGLFDVSDTQKSQIPDNIVEKLFKDTIANEEVQYGVPDLMSLILNPRVFLDEGNSPPNEYKNIPAYLQTEQFQSILGEINRYLEREKDTITQEVEGLSKQEALAYVDRLVMNYLNTEKSNLMNKLTQKDKKQSNKVAPKVASYISAIYLLKFLPDSVSIKKMVPMVSNVKHQYFKYVRDLLYLTKKHERFVYNMKIIKKLVEELNLKLARENNRDVKLRIKSPKTQAEFSNMDGENAFKEIILEDEAGNQYKTTGTDLQQKHVPKKLSGKVKYTFKTLEDKIKERKDELIFPKTKKEWDSTGGTPSDRNIVVKCGSCGQERPVMVRTYFDNKRCPTCFHIDTRKWDFENVKEMLKNRGFRLYKFTKRNWDAQKDKSPSHRVLHVKCKTCNWETWATVNTIANDKRFGCRNCEIHSMEDRCRWYMERIFSYLANELKKNPEKASKFSEKFKDWLATTQPDSDLYINFEKAWPTWLKEDYANLELDGYNKFLEIAFEYNGKQHYNIHTMTNAWSYGDKELGRQKFWQQWKNDKIKTSKSSDRAVILIVVPYRINPNDFQKFIMLEFKRFTGIDLSEYNIPNFNFDRRINFIGDAHQKKLDEFK